MQEKNNARNSNFILIAKRCSLRMSDHPTTSHVHWIQVRNLLEILIFSLSVEQPDMSLLVCTRHR